MNELKLSFLGPPRVEINGLAVVIPRRRGIALLAYLAIMGEPQPRDSLAALFWPESDHQRSHKSLRRDLSELNLALGSQLLDIDRESVGLRNGVWVDVAQFQQQLALCDNDRATCHSALTQAATLYRGDFLSGFTLADSPQFDEWQFFQSEHLRQAFASALAQLVDILSDQGEVESAITYARRWLNLDSLHEAAHRRLMQIYAQSGQQAAALRQYEACRQLLADELDVLPAPETTTLYQQIRAHTMAPAEVTTRRSAVAATRHNLPTQTTAFIGREEELADIQRLLLKEDQCRLLTLVGPGGIGKTRLALAAAAQAAHSFANGVFFVPLAPVSEGMYIVPAIAQALQFNFHGTTDPKEQLLAYLSKRQLLLVLDNFEQLLDGAGLLAEILGHATAVVLLVTSRERLNLLEEWSYELQGLAFPADINQRGKRLSDQGAKSSTTYSAVQLFLQRARQAETNFVPTSEDIDNVVRICQLVEGMPLGLELAAPWIRSLSCHDIAVEIERSLDFLTTTLRNMPERHRSLRVVFGQTWQRLSAVEQDVLRQLSVFRGGYTREAAEQVTQATLGVLLSLVDKALVRRLNTGRYELHELIRQFAEAQLLTDPEMAQQAQKRHRDYFIRFLEAKTSGIKGRAQKETLGEIKADIDNVRLAWRRAVAERDANAVERSAECLFVYYLYGNGYDEGQIEFRRAVAAFAGTPATDSPRPSSIRVEQQDNLVGYLLAAQGYFLAHRHDLPAGERLVAESLARLRAVKPIDRRKEAFALLWLGWSIYFQGRNAEAWQYAKESLAIFAEVGDRWGEGWSLLGVGGFLRDARPAEAEKFLRRGVILCQESGDQGVLGYFNFNLGSALRELGHYAQAQQYITEGIRLSRELDNILGLGYGLLRLGQLEIAQGNYPQAIQTLQPSLSYFNEVGVVHASMSRLYLGMAFHLAGDHNQAAQWYAQALEVFREGDNRPWLARCLSRLGVLAYDRDEVIQAEAYLLEALAVWQALVAQEADMAATLCQLGQMLGMLDESRHAEARQYLRQALALAAQHHLAPVALDACLGIGRLLAQAGETEQALFLLTLVEQHEAATFETRQTARQSMPVFMKPAHKPVRELWETVHGLLADP